MLVRIITAIIVFWAFIIILCPSAQSQSELRRGKEMRITTVNGITIQGKLKSYNHNALTILGRKSKLQTVALTEIKEAYIIERYFAGIGLVAGIVAATIIVKKNDWGYGSGASLVTIGFIACGITGYWLGHFIQFPKKVQLDMHPMYISPSGDIMSVKVGLVFNF